MGDLRATPLLLLFPLLLVAATEATQKYRGKVAHTVECSGSAMVVRVPASGGDVTGVELDKWGFLPGCATVRSDTHFTLTLPLDDSLACGLTRVRNKLTGDMVYYHRLAVSRSTPPEREVLLVKCSLAHGQNSGNNIVKRDVLPPEFVEPDFIEITSEVTGTAPIPILGVGVRQNGNLVGGQINVRPGTPLTMEVFLDDTSADIYGILMSYMEVTDTANKRETIIFNGCSVDPVLFDNFITTTGDYVSAKFRAFKFPETNYVLFRGTVDVCLDKCQGIACSNGELGFGRRRRGVDDQSADPNKIFEVTMKTFLKVEEEAGDGAADVGGAYNFTRTTIQTEEKRMAEADVDNKFVEGVEAVERALKEVVEESAREVAAMERALEEDTGFSSPWGRPAIVHAAGGERRDFRASEGVEPVSIYYNGALTHRQSPVIVVMTAIVALLVAPRRQ